MTPGDETDTMKIDLTSDQATDLLFAIQASVPGADWDHLRSLHAIARKVAQDPTLTGLVDDTLEAITQAMDESPESLLS